MIKVFSFAASCAGKNSHTKAVSDQIAEALKVRAEEMGETIEYECLTGADVRIDYCRSCTSCFFKGGCPLEESDDMAMLKKKILECDIFILGTPVYLWSMSGICKSFIDRISYWTHQFELLGKTCVVFSSTDSSHGPEVAKDLEELMCFTGAVIVNAGYADRNGLQFDLPELADKVMAVYKDPASGVTFFQERVFLSRVILVRKYFKRVDENDPKVSSEMRIFKERKLDTFVIMKEAIEAKRKNY